MRTGLMVEDTDKPYPVTGTPEFREREQEGWDNLATAHAGWKSWRERSRSC